jgi:excisionase family DNA binding protein
MDKRYYTPREVSELLRVSPTTVMKLIHDERLFAVHVSDRVYRIPIGALARLQAPESINHEPSVIRVTTLTPLGEPVESEHERLVTA